MSTLAEDKAGIEYDFYNLICELKKNGVTEEVIRKAFAAALAESFEKAETTKRKRGRPADPATRRRLFKMALAVQGGDVGVYPAAVVAADGNRSLAKSLDVAYRKKSVHDRRRLVFAELPHLLHELKSLVKEQKIKLSPAGLAALERTLELVALGIEIKSCPI